MRAIEYIFEWVLDKLSQFVYVDDPFSPFDTDEDML